MLTRLTVRNFKRFKSVEIELDEHVVFIGPNDAGKTTALQALALWEFGMRRWHEKRSGKKVPRERAGVTLNRRELAAIPLPDSRMLWAGMHTRNTQRGGESARQRTENVYIEICVEGTRSESEGGGTWRLGLEFYLANPE